MTPGTLRSWHSDHLLTYIQTFRHSDTPSLIHSELPDLGSDINIRIDFQGGLLISHNQYLTQIRITCPPSKETCLPRRLLFGKDSPRGTSPTTIRNHIPKRFELIFLYIYISSYGERSFIIHYSFIHTSIQHILIFYTTSSHHPITSSFFILLYCFIIISPYTITDLSFGVVPGDNPALSPVLLVDAGYTSKRSNSELSVRLLNSPQYA